MDAPVTIVMFFAALRWALFEILLQSTHHVSSARQEVCFARPLAEAPFLFVALKVVLIDSVWRDDSNGCHIVFWSNLTSTWKSGLSARFSSRLQLSNPLFSLNDSQKVVQWSYKYAQSIELALSFPKRHSSPYYYYYKIRYEGLGEFGGNSSARVVRGIEWW